MTDATTMVIPASVATTTPAPTSASRSGPMTNPKTRTNPNTPALTTATACSSDDTGVGATMADGSQRCSGIMAALVPNPSVTSATMMITPLLEMSPSR